MEQPINQFDSSTRNNSPLVPVIVSVILTAVIVGGVIFSWANHRANLKQVELEHEILSLKKQISQLQQVSPTPETNTKVYQNPTLGFQLTLPNKSWYTEGLHFYSSESCAKLEFPYPLSIDCLALEVQNHDSEFFQGPDATFNNLKAAGQNPVKLPSLIPGAVVIKSNAPGPAGGWSWEYDIFFSSAKKRFLIFTNDVSLEQSVLPTFKLLN